MNQSLVELKFDYFQFLSILCSVVSLFLLFIHFCTFGANLYLSQFEFLKFMYFRSARCETKFQWTFVENPFDISLVNGTEVLTSLESLASRQTLFITISYLVINSTLAMTAFVAICKKEEKSFSCSE